jgi:hypothetical protein
MRYWAFLINQRAEPKPVTYTIILKKEVVKGSEKDQSVIIKM